MATIEVSRTSMSVKFSMGADGDGKEVFEYDNMKLKNSVTDDEIYALSEEIAKIKDGQKVACAKIVTTDIYA